MSQNPSETLSSSNYGVIFDNALKAYKKKTGKDLASDPLLRRLESCNSPDTVLTLLREQVPGFDQLASSDEKLTKWVDPAVNFLFAFSSTIGGVVSSAYPPAGVIFAGISSLLSAAQGVSASQGALIDTFERLENFFRRLEIYIEIPPTPGLIDIIVKVMTDVLIILALATREIKQGKLRRFWKKLIGMSDIEDALRRLDKLTQEEHRMATAQGLKATHGVDERVMNVANNVQVVDDRVQVVDDRVQVVDDRVQVVDDRVQAVSDEVQVVDDRVQVVDDRVQAVGDKMQVVDDKVQVVDDKVQVVDDKVQVVDDKVQVVDDRVQVVDDKVQVIDDRVKGVGDKMEVVIDGTEQIRGELQQVVIHLDDKKQDKFRKDLEKWLSPPDPSTNYNTARDTHHEGTAVWLIENSAWKDWKKSGSFLWIYGKPGAGKSVLTSAIIRDFEGVCTAGPGQMAYYFFDFKDTGKQDTRGLLSSLIIQLCGQSRSLTDVPFKFYSTLLNGSQKPSIPSLTQCLEGVLRAAGDVPIYVIIDALDECPNTTGIPSSRDQVLDLVEKLVKMNIPSLHLCVTSRPEVDIRTTLDPLTSPLNRISLHDQNGQRKDIVDFVSAIVYSDRKMRRWRDEDKKLVIEMLSERADGMFRWVYCQLETLRHCLPASVRGVLAELPESLDETYEQILLQIPKSNRVHAHRLLQCLMVAARPLRVEELAEVLAIDFSMAGKTPTADEKLRWEDKEQAVLTACSSLIVIVNSWGSPVVQFSHFSVKEFLTSDRLAASTVDSLRFHHIRLEAAHTTMAQACLSVVFRLDNHMDKQSIRSRPLTNYAGQHFGDHAEFENVLPHITDGVDNLLDPDKPQFDMWLWLQLGDWGSRFWYYSRSLIPSPSIPPPPPPLPTYPPRVAPLYYVAALGHLCLARRLISRRPNDLQARDHNGCAPLHIAIHAQRAKVSQLIIEHSTDLNIRDVDGRTPLYLAVYEDLPEIAQMLLERDTAVKADVNARDNAGQTALHIASKRHFTSMVALLLKFGADVDALDNDNMTPLLLALQSSPFFFRNDDRRSTAVVQLLLDHRANIHVRDESGQTPLHLASQHGVPSLVALLLKFGAVVDAQDNQNMTPLHLAPQSSKFSLNNDDRSLAVAQVLLEHHANIHAQNKSGQKPLHLASQHGVPSIVASLLKSGADVDAKDNDDMTPLHFAALPLGSVFHEGITSFTTSQPLLEHGASVHMRNKNGRTPLHLASQRVLSGLVTSLVKSGADLNAQDDDNMTPLLLALQFYPRAAPLLLELGADVNVRNNKGQTPLHVASQSDDLSFVTPLLERGADVGAQDDDKMTPLHLVVLSLSRQESFYGDLEPDGDAKVVTSLLERGASVEVQNNKGETPLQLASAQPVLMQLLSNHTQSEPKDIVEPVLVESVTQGMTSTVVTPHEENVVRDPLISSEGDIGG